VAGGADWRSAAGHAAKAGTNTSGAGLFFETPMSAAESCSVEARCLYKQGKWIEREIVRETVFEQAKPTILRDIGELLTLLWALVFEAKHILNMMNHLMNENR
jgi:hypothetical protein